MDLEAYRASPAEAERTADLIRLLPTGLSSVLDIGARDGFFSRLLCERFAHVTALDLSMPTFEIEGVTKVAGNVRELQFADNSFDCVFCAEVLEHVAGVEQAVQEMIRVARHEIIVGVPYRQDTRCGRTKCSNCGRINPPWGHINVFDETWLESLFKPCSVVEKSYVGQTTDVTNIISAFLMDVAGCPRGTYDQEEPCIYCGAKLEAPKSRSFFSKACSIGSVKLQKLQIFFSKPKPIWIHVKIRKN
ncbi:MAG: class I SAM-dependent methyltransferase [Thermoguttaceae bacterium]|jgi:SAM-dependent methyltransferase